MGGNLSIDLGDYNFDIDNPVQNNSLIVPSPKEEKTKSKSKNKSVKQNVKPILKDGFYEELKLENEDSIYTGNIVNNLKNGKGFVKFTKYNATYDGEWKDDLYHGFGIFLYGNGDVYEGFWENGKYNGEGTVTFADNTFCKGIWKDGIIFDGEGIMEYSNGNIFEGTWKFGKAYGFGILQYSDGSIYKGLWENGLAHGKGTFTFADGSTFCGTFAYGKCNEYGVLTSHDVCCKGVWKNGLKHGNFVIVCNNKHNRIMTDKIKNLQNKFIGHYQNNILISGIGDLNDEILKYVEKNLYILV